MVEVPGLSGTEHDSWAEQGAGPLGRLHTQTHTQLQLIAEQDHSSNTFSISATQLGNTSLACVAPPTRAIQPNRKPIG